MLVYHILTQIGSTDIPYSVEGGVACFAGLSMEGWMDKVSLEQMSSVVERIVIVRKDGSEDVFNDPPEDIKAAIGDEHTVYYIKIYLKTGDIIVYMSEER